MNTNREARWKGAGMGEYYCSLCCEIGDVRERRCPNCNALTYTDKEYAEKEAFWALEDSLDNGRESTCGGGKWNLREKRL